MVGYLTQKISKEANVFRINIVKQPSFFRTNFSLNIYEARKKVADFITEHVGEFRDFNGGKILEQSRLLLQLKEAFSAFNISYPDVIENFFYSLIPIELQTTLSVVNLQSLFSLFLEVSKEPIPKKQHYQVRWEKGEEVELFCVGTSDRSLLNAIEEIKKADAELFSQYVTTHWEFQGTLFFGGMIQSKHTRQYVYFKEKFSNFLQSWAAALQKKKTLRISYAEIPKAMDPRNGGHEYRSSLLRCLFEGLMRYDKHGELAPAIAESVASSYDHKEYTFFLRESFWSNGMKVTAHDFAYSWKKSLSQSFYTPYAFFFYPIKNAKKAKEGQMPLSEVGIEVIDERTLRVSLEAPTPYFLGLTAHILYAPIPHKVEEKYPNWSSEEGARFVCNGPFCLQKLQPNVRCELEKNPYYWDAKNIMLDEIKAFQTLPQTAYEMFQDDEIDWLGRPSREWESYFAKEANDEMGIGPLCGVSWYTLNTQKFPFNHQKIRKAFALAINRREAIRQLPGQGYVPATSPLPLAHAQHMETGFPDSKQERAKELFQEALEELNLTHETFPSVSFIYVKEEIREVQAKVFQKQWKEVLGVDCQLEGYDWTTFFPKLTQGDYQIGGISWVSWINDPIYTLNSFRNPANRVNFASWEDKGFQSILAQASHEICPKKRLQLFAKAEEILIDQVPVIPIFCEMQSFITKQCVEVPQTSELGHLDFRWVTIK